MLAEGMSEEEMHRAMFERVINDVLTHGWHLTGVFSDEDNETFCYTTGMVQSGRPDVMVVGLDPQLASTLLHLLVGLDQPLELGREYDKVLDGYKVKLVEPLGSNAEEMTGSVQWHQSVCPDRELKLLQMVWPDVMGRYPGEAGYNATPQVVKKETVH
jgi:hypothetical protein